MSLLGYGICIANLAVGETVGGPALLASVTSVVRRGLYRDLAQAHHERGLGKCCDFAVPGHAVGLADSGSC